MDPLEDARFLPSRRRYQDPGTCCDHEYYKYDDDHATQKSARPSSAPQGRRRLLSALAIVAGLVWLAFTWYHLILGCADRDSSLRLSGYLTPPFHQHKEEDSVRPMPTPGFPPREQLSKSAAADKPRGALRTADPCSPSTIQLSDLSKKKKNQFYAQMGRLPPPPVFHAAHTSLCTDDYRAARKWGYCLPISGSKDEQSCAIASRLDLLTPQNKQKQLCFASVLDMLLVDVYEILHEHGASPALLYGSLLGAVRNGAVIPFTEDVDLGYKSADEDDPMPPLRKILFAHGYHLFHQGIWRVCVAPTHPLASRLYDRDHALAVDSETGNIPYVDLYEMERSADGSGWQVDKTVDGRTTPNDKMDPYSQVIVNGISFDTVADPIDFLIKEYGEEYMVPKPRR